MKIVKRIALGLFIILLLVIAAAIAIPYFYKDEIVAYVKEDINKQINAKVDFKDVSLSLFRNFPDFSLGLAQLSVDGIQEFEGTRLLEVENFGLTLDLWSVISQTDPVEIKKIQLTKPAINVQVLRNGKANYDIAKSTETAAPEETSSDTGNFKIKLSEYSVTDASLIYNDKAGDMYLQIDDLDHSGNGNFTTTVFDLFTKTSIQKLTARTGGITYLNKAKTALDATFNINTENSKYTLKDNDLRLNALRIVADGFVQMLGDDIKMDMNFKAPSNQFKDLLSLIPGAYIEGYEDVKANGDVKLAGFVKGTYNGAKEQLPAFKFDIEVKNGDFKYPDLPLGVNAINTLVNINSPSSNLDKITVDVPRFAMKLGQNPFEARLKLRTPMSDPDVDTQVKGKINLEELAKAFPMEGVKKMNGLIDADFSMATRMSYIDKAQYEKVDMAGDLNISNMNYNTTDMPPIRINNLKMDFTPQFVKVDDFDAVLGKSDLQASGKLDNILAYFAPDKTMKGTFKVRSNYFNADEWMPPSEETASTTTEETPTEETTEIFDRFDFSLDAQINKIKYDVYELKNNVAVGNFTPSKLTISDFQTLIGNSDMKGSGVISNVFNYLFEGETLGGKINLASNLMDLNQFMAPAPSDTPKAKTISNTAETENLEPILIPDNIDMTINAKMKEVIYTNMTLKDVDGTIIVKEEAVRMDNTSANTLGGNFVINGGYDTKDKEKPTFDFDYDIKSLNFQKAFKTLNTFQAVAPIGEYIEGKFNSTLKMSGVLGKDMMPDLNTLSIDGFLHTLNAVVKDFKPLKEVGNKLNVNYFDKIELKNTKNWFEIKDGKVIVKEFPYTFKNIAMKIGGTHSLTQDMDYKINAKIPRELLEKGGAAGATVSKGLGFLNTEASKYGVNLDVGKFINVLIGVKGSIKQPKISIKPLGSDGEKDLVSSVKEEVETKVKAVIDEKKEEVKAVIDDKKEDLKKKADAEADKIMADARKKAAQAKAKAKQVADKARDRAYKEADDAAQKAGNNPIKKLAAKKAAELAKKQADKTHKKALKKANEQADKIMQQAEKRAAALRKKYE